MNTTENFPKRIGLLANITLVLLMLLPTGAYIALWWFISKTSFLAIFLIVTVGGPIWCALQIAWGLCVLLSQVQVPRLSIDGEGGLAHYEPTATHSH